jgi:glycosyltransferase involved in cell wall biosynthesis
MRVLWVVPRYGAGILGGAESLVRAHATRAAATGWRAEVATTCARDHETWANELPPGETVEDGVVVRRFPVGPRDTARHDVLHTAVMAGRAGYADELEWLSQSVWSPELGEYLEDTVGDHDLRILAPYLFGTTVWGAQYAPEGSALLPCLHDEPYAHLTTVRRLLAAVRGCLFNAPGEERLGRRLAPVRDGGVVGMGYDPPEGSPPDGFAERHGIEGPYLLYAGRIEAGKRVDVAVEYAARLGRELPGAPRLALLGRGSYRVPEDAAPHVVRLGFLPDEDVRSAHAGALALVNPSHMESLSLVLMEAWLEGVPGLVAEGSEVLRDHVARSGGGIAFGDYGGFRDAVTLLLRDPAARERMGAAGRTYVLDQYGWPAVWARLEALVERLAA